MNTRTRSLRTPRLPYCLVVVLTASAVLPSCKTMTGSVKDLASPKNAAAPSAAAQPGAASPEAPSPEATSPQATSQSKSRRDADVRLVSDEQVIDEAAAPGAATAPAAAGAASALPLPIRPNYSKRIPGKPLKAAVASSLPAMPREYDQAANCAPPIPYGVVTPFNPPGIKGPWPQDEYLHDGGDAEEPVAVSPEWRVQGLNVEDTVAHYDTLDGRTLVEQSNCAYIYAPRFSSVRSVASVVSSEYIDAPTKIVDRNRITVYDERARAGTKLEQQTPVGSIANVKLGNYRGDQGTNVASTALMPHNYQQTLLAFENLSVIRTGTMQGSEKARLAERSEAAIAWSKADGVKVLLDKQFASITSGTQKAQAIYVVKGPTDARLRICKIASTPAAQPGDVIDFTIRYDNIGDQTVGNVVILDSLTTRLAYVPDSAQSSREAHFDAVENAAESLELRWEIEEPIKPGEGGLVRFKCKVR